MDNFLIKEINRFRSISGLPMINEQFSLIDDLIKSGVKRIPAIDQVLNVLKLEGKQLTDLEINNLCLQLNNSKVFSTDVVEKIRQILIKEKNIAYAIANSEDNYLLALRKSKSFSEDLVQPIKRAVDLSKDEVSTITKNTIEVQMSIVRSNISKSFKNLDETFFKALVKLEGQQIHNAEEIFDAVDNYINNKLTLEISNGMNPITAEEIFKIYSNKIRTDSKTKSILDLYKNKGMIANLPKRTNSVTYGSEVDTGWLNYSRWKKNSISDDFTQTQQMKTPYDPKDESFLTKPTDPVYLPKDSGNPKVSVNYMDFVEGATTSTYKKVKEPLPPNDVLLSEIKKIIDKRLGWLRSPEYYKRRMSLTGESIEDIDIAIEKIRKYIDEDLTIKFERDPSSTSSGTATQYSRNKTTNEMVNSEKEILIQPHETNIEMFNTLDHEIDHIMTAVTDGGASSIANKNLVTKFENILNLTHPIYDRFNFIKDTFDKLLLGKNFSRTSWTKYMNDNGEKIARLNRLNNWFKNKYNISDQVALTDDNMKDIIKEYTDDWVPNGPPKGLEDVKYLLDEYFSKNPIKKTFFKSSFKEELKNALNASFAIAALFSLYTTDN